MFKAYFCVLYWCTVASTESGRVKWSLSKLVTPTCNRYPGLAWSLSLCATTTSNPLTSPSPENLRRIHTFCSRSPHAIFRILGISELWRTWVLKSFTPRVHARSMISGKIPYANVSVVRSSSASSSGCDSLRTPFTTPSSGPTARQLSGCKLPQNGLWLV